MVRSQNLDSKNWNLQDSRGHPFLVNHNAKTWQCQVQPVGARWLPMQIPLVPVGVSSCQCRSRWCFKLPMQIPSVFHVANADPVGSQQNQRPFLQNQWLPNPKPMAIGTQTNANLHTHLKTRPVKKKPRFSKDTLSNQRFWTWQWTPLVPLVLLIEPISFALKTNGC